MRWIDTFHPAVAPTRQSVMDLFVQDLRFAVRTLLKKPGFVAAAVATLAVGVGANAAVFSLVNGVFFKSLPGLERSAGLVEISRDLDGNFFDMSFPVITHLREESSVLEDIAAFTLGPVALGGEPASAVYMGLQTTGNYFSMLDLKPALGRFFAPEESFYPNVSSTSVISHKLWETRFASSPDVLGKTLLINGHPTEIIGVAPRGFGGHVVGLKIDVFVPVGVQAPGLHGAGSLEHRESGILEVLGRLRHGASVAQARVELTALANTFMADLAPSGEGYGYVVRVEKWGPVQAAGRKAITAFFGIMMTAVALLLSMACINVANMLLSRATERGGEIAIRMAMGSSHWRIVRLLLTESLVLFLFACVAGIVLATWATSLLLAFEPPLPAGFDIELNLGLDWRVLTFSLAITVVAGVVFSLAPALHATRPDLVHALRDRTAAGEPTRTRLRSALVAGQMAGTVILLITAGLFLRALSSLEALDTGWNSHSVQVMSFDLEYGGYGTERGLSFYRELLDRVRQSPGVESAALARKLPLAGRSSLGDINVAGVEAPQGRTGFVAYYNTVTRGYFGTLHISLLQGRDFGEADAGSGRNVAIINQAMAQRFWPAGDAIGSAFYAGQVAEGTAFEVVGVVENVKYHRLVEQTPNFYYLPLQQRYNAQMTLHLREAVGTGGAVSGVRRVARGLDPGLPIVSTLPLDEALDMSLLPQRMAAWVTGVLGFIGLLLGAVGIYGVTAFAIGQRTRELGIRIALGAQTSNVLRMMTWQGMIAPLVGTVVGLAVALAVTRFLGSFIAGVSPVDPLTFGVVVAGLCGVALCAILVPATRAARLDPAATLRSE